MMKSYVSVADVKRFLKEGGKRQEIQEYMGFSTATTINKWIARKSVPRWHQKRIKEFFLEYELKKVKTPNV
jgi:hypothetical protein